MAQAAPDWVRCTEHAAFEPRDSCGEVVFGGRMWLLGGWFNSNSLGPRDVWSSADGLSWQKAAAEAGWKHGDLPTSLAFADRMWLLGGWYGGRLAEGGPSNEVWASADGAKWECVTAHAPFSARLGAGGAVHDGRMWLLGGSEQYFFGNDSHLRSDVWSSADGRDWTCATARAPWAPRAYHQALEFRGKLWVLGGGNYLPEYRGYNDVWCSADGATWEQATAAAPWAPRIWFSTVVYRGCMWVLGGWSKEPNRNYNDVWYSRDGVEWKELKTPTIWSERHEQSYYVFDDRIWIVAGNAWPLVNDVWYLQLPENWQP